ncbi:hypothetical protein RclHR1_04140008 [Rhizophagus clarus]|uniref:Uncharacterized protein n=1 Tax=Rhizophagus clarus TaxID=94130 RepID=A0A2Z6RJP8_9GLOM|nr:hypothetical protein RclHR1_04140008 [Rhizophagus clarus]
MSNIYEIIDSLELEREEANKLQIYLIKNPEEEKRLLLALQSRHKTKEVQQSLLKSFLNVMSDQQMSRKRKLNNSFISTEGPIFHYSGRLALPIYEREIFNTVKNGIKEEKSFVIHGPYQSGKTSFLIALEEMLREHHLNVARFDMTDVKGHIIQYGARGGFFRYLSRHLFRETVDELSFNEYLSGFKDRLYLLVDEFQYIFESQELYNASSDFFRSLSSKNVTYVCVGTFKVVDLLSDDNPLGSPYNKATFLPMPFFTTEELGKLFRLYNEFFDEIIPIDIQSVIMRESFGHPASFMILLKLYHDYRTNSPIEWNLLLKENLENYLNGTHVKIIKALRRMNSTDLAHVRGFTVIKDGSWIVDLSNLSEIVKYLLNIGILVPLTKDRSLRGVNRVSFTSNVIFRVVFREVWPKPGNSLQIQDVKDPLSLLAHALQNITPATIINERVRNLHGPSEKAFQAAVFCVINELLPISMDCLFEVKIREHEALNLMVIQNNNNWCGYEFKVEKISSAQFKDPVKQAKRYAEYFGMNIYLVNFYNDGGSTPAVINVPEDVTLVNVKYNAECTKFTINTNDVEISINVS